MRVRNSERVKVTTNLRGVETSFFVWNERMLWQCLGQEHIEPEQLDWIEGLQSETVLIDVGASIGNFSAFAVKSGRKVLAVEPDLENYRALCLNLELNGLVDSGSSCLNVAAGATQTADWLYYSDASSGAHQKTLNPRDRENSRARRRKVEVHPLDSLVRSFSQRAGAELALKVDVDGSELDVLMGASELLANPHLKTVFVETEVESESEEGVVDLLSKAGFISHLNVPVARYPRLAQRIFVRSDLSGRAKHRMNQVSDSEVPG